MPEACVTFPVLRRARVAAACAALVLLGLAASVSAQVPKPNDLPPCPAGTPPDPSKPCMPAPASVTPDVTGTAGSGGGAGGAGGGGGSRDSAARPESLGPYRVVKVMNAGGEEISGLVCAIDRPFSVHMVTPKITFDIAFVPEDRTHGTYTYAYSFPSLGETHEATGAHTITPARADGTRSLSINGRDHVQFRGFNGQMPMVYTMGLEPLSSPTPCGP